jgi:hypothetical protein
MIQLSAIDEHGNATVIASAAYFRITGGAVWIGPAEAADMPLVRFTAGSWQRADQRWTGLRFEGRCRLIFGLPRDPAGVSGAIDGVSACGATLTANGIPFAAYDEDREMWRGVGANTWWHAFRIETAGLRTSVDSAESADRFESSFAPSENRGDISRTFN